MVIHFSDIRRSLCLGLVSFLTAVSALVAVAPKTALADPFTYGDVSAGFRGNCSLTTDGRALCWGWNYQGYLGVGSRETSVTVPSVVVTPAGVRFVSIEAGNYFTSCGLTTTGAVYCWGESALGRWTGAPSITPVLVALPTGVVATQLSVGASHACVISNNGVYCWGNWSTGELGVGIIEPTVTPVLVTLPNNQTAISIAAGVAFTCAATTTGSAYCWGTNDEGQTGIGSISSQRQGGVMYPTAVLIPNGVNIVQVTAGLERACALDSAGNAWCWGRNYNGSFGDGTYIRDSPSPRRVDLPAGTALSSISTGWYHTCGLTTTGTLLCWGTNDSGELGTGTTLGGKTIRQTVLPDGVVAASISAGGSKTCMLTTTNEAWCWGLDLFNPSGPRDALSYFPRKILPVGTPSIASPTASAVQAEQATVSASINPNGNKASVVLALSKNSSLAESTVRTIALSASLQNTPAKLFSSFAIRTVLADLDPQTIYYFQFRSTNALGSTSSVIGSFTTTGEIPSVNIDPISDIHGDSGMASMRVHPHELATTTELTYAQDASFTRDVHTVALGTLRGNDVVALRVNLTDLDARTEYFVRVSASNRLGSTLSPVVSFTTVGALPTATTGSATTTGTGATIETTVNAMDTRVTTSVQYWPTSSGPEQGQQTPSRVINGTTDQSLSFEIDGLKLATEYNYRIVATNNLGTTTGDTRTLRTRGGSPIVSAVSATDISQTEATIKASINSNEFSTFTKLQVSTDRSFADDVSEYYVARTPAGSTRQAIVPLGGLTPRTNYFVRFIATNSLGSTTSTSIGFVTRTPIGVSINNGDSSTDSARVVLSLGAPDNADSVIISNNRAFSNQRVFDLDSKIDWTLVALGESKADTRTVFVKFVLSDDTTSAVFSDSITLTAARTSPDNTDSPVDIAAPAKTTKPDVVAPVVVAATVDPKFVINKGIATSSARTRLTLSTHDNASGIARIEVRDATKKKTVIRYAVSSKTARHSIKVPVGSRAIQFRVLDSAGNATAWKTIEFR